MDRTANDLLKATARSFYLTLRVLPGRVRTQIGLAYLLARTTDTIADTGIVPVIRRLDALQALRQRILGESDARLELGEMAGHQGSAGERMLLERIEDSLAVLQRFSAGDQGLVREVLQTITSGQELDLKRFGGTAKAGSNRGEVVALKSAAELDDYTYRVAGCVGEFWTKLCRTHLFPEAALDEQQLIADGIRFGKGLQLVNILRDLPADLANGRCYVPWEAMSPEGLSPENLLAPENEPRFLPLFRRHLDMAEAHLAAGWRYTNRLPFGQFRVRLACAWPILLGMKTIQKLRAADVAGLRRRVKVSRGEVYAIMARSTLASPVAPAWRRLYRATNSPSQGEEKR